MCETSPDLHSPTLVAFLTCVMYESLVVGSEEQARGMIVIADQLARFLKPSEVEACKRIAESVAAMPSLPATPNVKIAALRFGPALPC